MEPPIKPAAPVMKTFMEKLRAWVSDGTSIEDLSVPNKPR